MDCTSLIISGKDQIINGGPELIRLSQSAYLNGGISVENDVEESLRVLSFRNEGCKN